MTTETDKAKLHQLMENEGYASLDELFEASVFDSLCPSICKFCDYTEDMEPDQNAGWCPECNTNSVVSALILGGLI